VSIDSKVKNVEAVSEQKKNQMVIKESEIQNETAESQEIER
jgi:hypothetical protein